MRLISFLILSFSPLAWAIPTPNLGLSQPQWQCQISAVLHGNPQHFMYYGRDSWNGVGELRCKTQSGLNQTRNLSVSFNSYFDGFGADSRSVLDVRIYIATYASPFDLQMRGVVSDIDHGPNIRFAFATTLSEARVYILSSSPDSAMRSLQKGTVFIRGTGEML